VGYSPQPKQRLKQKHAGPDGGKKAHSSAADRGVEKVKEVKKKGNYGIFRNRKE
jgi:hypothetical protein